KTHISDGLRNRDTTPLSVSRRVRPHADTSTFPWTAMCGRDDMPPLSSGHIPGITQQLRLLASDWPPELELRRGTQTANHRRGGGACRGGAEQQREEQRRSSEGAAGEGRQLTARYAGCTWEREGASPGWSRSQQGKYHWCQWEE
ncbi:unnamed protein product, partial [Staurois parvus]